MQRPKTPSATPLAGARRPSTWLPVLSMLMAFAAPASAAETMGGSINLIPGPVVDGVAHVGLQIDLKPGWHTYWRYPGDSGVPPELTSAGSQNVSGVTVDFPAPMRFGDASDQTIGYQGSVVLLLNARLVDPTKAAGLTINARLGICREICVPIDETLTLPVDPATPTGPAEAAKVASAQALVPTPVSAGADLSITGIRRDASVKPEMVTFSVKGPAAQLGDVFVEGPAGWALPLPSRVSASGDESVWSFVLDGLPSGAEAKGTRLTFTIVGKDRATTQTLLLE